MQYYIDSANLEAIRRIAEYYPLTGVTTNPTIIAREQTDFLPLIRSIREIIGPTRVFHVQTTADTAEGILKEAYLLRNAVGGNFCIKVPISQEGIKATMMLEKEEINVTVTGIFTQQQALIAAEAGADYVAPYVNRLDNIVSDGVSVVGEIVTLFRQYHLPTKVLAASFKSVEQVHKALMAGTDAITIEPALFEKLLYHPLTINAIADFNADWSSVYGERKIPELLGDLR